MRTRNKTSISGAGHVLFPGGVHFKSPKSGFYYVARGKRPPELFGWVQLNVPFVVIEKYFHDARNGRRKSDTCRVMIERDAGEVTEVTVVFVTDKRARKTCDDARLIAENVHVIKGPWW